MVIKCTIRKRSPFQMCRGRKHRGLAARAIRPPRRNQKFGSRRDSACRLRPEQMGQLRKNRNYDQPKQKNLTRVLCLSSDFFIISTTKGSDFPIKSVAGNSSADTTVTERTPLMIISFFLAAGF